MPLARRRLLLELYINKLFSRADVSDSETKMVFAVLAVLGLTFSGPFNAFVVWLMMPYLTDVWKLSFNDAAAIVNVWRGLMSTLPIFMLYIADTVTGKFWLILLSSVASSAGFVLLAMSTPPVFTKETGGTCTSYEPDCITDDKRILLLAALILIAFGISGVCVLLPAVILIPLAAIISMSYIKPWSIKFGLPAICTTAATLLFISGSRQYSREPPKGSPFTTVFRVICAAASKMFIRTPKDAGLLYERVEQSDDHGLFLDHTNDLRFLDKAATFLPKQQQEQQKRNRWRLCTVTEVEETKLVIRSMAICSFFIICGLVSAIGHTYFISQASHLKRNKFPLLFLPYLCELWKSNYGHLFSKCGPSSRYHPPIGIAVSMVFAILCCITAAKVETRRLDVVKRHGLLDKPDDEIPFYIGNLAYQFALLGALDGIFELSVASFFKKQVPPTMSPYLTWLGESIRGVGITGGVLSVFVIGKISESGGHLSWFQDTLNRSRLDKYYWTLAVLVSVNLALYTWAAFRFKYKDSSEFESRESPGFEETMDEIRFGDPETLRSDLNGSDC
ncbi:hypothetical protein V6N11_033250 [Hibiscus sabdariffa]|uniref:Uncharacterized protein n=1 Tax=Hibiscus sabdariffa TaxID=183260 RepID=A0ABR2PXJ2_9ROSI